MGSPQRGQSGRPAESTDSACFEKAITWSWLSQKRMLGASSAGEATEAPPADDAPSIRFWLSHDQVIAFSKQAESVLSAGRPLCPRCGLPMDAAGHPCPVMNGARPIF